MSSTFRHLRGVVLLSCLLFLIFPKLVSAGELKIGGTGNALGTMRLLVHAFIKQNPGANVVVLESIGSSGAIRAVPKSAIGIGLSTRVPTEEESKTGVFATEYARTPTVFAVQEKNSFPSLTTSQVADIYSGKMKYWPDGTPVRPVLRQRGDDNTKQISSFSPEIEKALMVAEMRSGVQFAVTDQEAADKAETIPGSFVVLALALIKSEGRDLRALPLNGIEPNPENLAAGRYPLFKRFFFLLPSNPSPEAMRFIQFVKSSMSREILIKTGHIVP